MDDLDKLLDEAVGDAPKELEGVDDSEIFTKESPDNGEDLEPTDIPEPVVELSMSNIVFTNSRNDLPEANSDEKKVETVNDEQRQPRLVISRFGLKFGKRKRMAILLPKQGD